jgi:hypothetical protein
MKGYNKKYHSVVAAVGGRMIDRTKTFLDCGFNIVIEDEIPTNIKTVGDFSTVVNDTAREIIDISKVKNKPIGILYSGGLDSTCVVAAFLRQGATITVIYSEASIKENPVFYDEVLRNNNQVIHHLGNPYVFLRDNKDNYIFVTGECGGNIMGTPRPYGHAVSYKLTEYGNVMKNANAFYHLDDELKAMYLLLYEKSPVPLKTNYDALWWTIFVLKRQWIKYRIRIWAGVLCEDFFNFFMTDNFQMWALTNDVTVKCPDFNFKNWKMPMKDYIYSYCPYKEASYDIPKRRSSSLTYDNLSDHNRAILFKPRTIVFLDRKEEENVLDNLRIRELDINMF